VKSVRSLLIAGIMSTLLSALSSAVGQEHSLNQAGCELIDKNRPAQSISYDGTSETSSDLTLILHNNTSCSIILETDDRRPTGLSRLPNGGVSLETVTSSQSKVRLPLHYLVQDRQRWKAPQPAYGWGDSVFTYELVAGQSAAFTVPLFHFRKRLDVAVPFNYAWESGRSIGMGVGGVVHRVYFLVEDVPEAVLREKR
jgi:hypothetical protein